MSTRLVMVAAVVIAAVAIAFTVIRVGFVPAKPTARASLSTGVASYLGVYETGPPHNYRPVTEFAAAAGLRPNLVGYYSGWAEPFATSFAAANRSRGAATVVQIHPTFT